MPCCAWKAVTPLEPYTDTCAILVALDRTANCHIISCAPTYRLPDYTTPPGGQGRSNISSCFAEALPGEMLTGWTGQRTPERESASPGVFSALLLGLTSG